MDIWFLRDMQRLARERSTIRHLEETADWLIGTDWKLDGELCLDALIRAHGYEYQVRMIYPALFPEVPPIVRPKDPGEHWSSHQYLDGTMCLEWGPDTWHPNVTGARVLESVHKLLCIENPFGSGQHQMVHSRHSLTTGQTVRASFGRFYVGYGLAKYLSCVPARSSGRIVFSIHMQSKSCLVLVQQIQSNGLEPWEDASTPPGMRASEGKSTKRNGVFYKTDLDADLISAIDTVADIQNALEQAGFDDFKAIGLGNTMEREQSLPGVLLLDSAGNPHFFVLLDLEEGKTLRLTPVCAHEAETNPRIPADLQELNGKSVGIVGVGSVGSRMALSLARTGVSRFLLVDEDIFLPENICRHALDWQNVGEHKVDAMAEMLSRIAPEIEVDVSHLNLTGQESTASLSGVLNKLGQCDLLVDATADPQVFNLMTAMTTTYARPFVWMEVFAGGSGGMIARSRPGLDPDPHTMRAAYHHYTSETTMPNLVVTANYTAEDTDGHVLPATDADVAVIAYHATRLALDTLLDREPSMFPYSMYLIGLTRSWVFDAPFHTIPIATDHLPRNQSITSVPSEVLSDNAAFLTNLLGEKDIADSPT